MVTGRMAAMASGASVLVALVVAARAPYPRPAPFVLAAN
jgi:hypothetical protein